MSVSSSHYNADAYVTAANPAPGRVLEFEYPIRSGSGWTTGTGSREDGGIGLNVYVAGGTGPAGVIPVSQTNPTSVSLSGVSISGILEVTTSAGNPVEITGAVYVLNQSSGSSFSGVLTATITGTPDVNVLNFPATQSVYVVNQTSGTVSISGVVAVSQTNVPATQTVALSLTGALPVSGNVGVVGTATVSIASASVPFQVFGAVLVSGTATVSLTGVLPVSETSPVTGVFVLGTASFSQTNLPATQSVFVVNQTSGSTGGVVEISGVTPVSGAVPVTGTVSVAGLAFSGTVSIPIEAYPNSLENVEFTRKKQLFDLDGASVNYVGYAVLGTSPASASWAIKRLTFNASGNLAATEWSSTSSVWNNRGSEVYS